MAGRGRGRGRGQMTFNLEDVGIGRGDSLPPTTFKPSPLFPPMPAQPVPLQTGDEVEYMLALKQEMRVATKTLPFYIRRAAPKRVDVDRYSDKYQSGEPKDSTIEWSPDWSRLPKELCIKVRKPQGKRPTTQVKRPKKPLVGKEEILTKLENLEKKEEAVNSEEEEDEEKKKTNEEEEQADEEDYEEDFEEDTDYIMSYFENGEEFGGDSDDNMDEATY
ncbi:DNA-directed RNA polymerase III subunit RPC7-like isoform X4 [Coregonus clupeaformis]|uniref:DNA-directed RNA polymerase III subunit RPC7-like isoform X4 n=2 Tax=Coregonus clupeaformis TaxID=59861 RepID=UPI001E1C2F1A|nr:DNA-directed RNA polymerase III subunit RPC7-like isoform X4 [Coregonus clupeaformis]